MQALLAELAVREVERELAVYWEGYWVARQEPGAVRTGSAEGWHCRLSDCIDRVVEGPYQGVPRQRGGLADAPS